MVDHGLEIYSQPIAGRIKVEGSGWSICRKLLGDDSVVIEMAVVYLFHSTGNVTCTVIGDQSTLLLKLFIFWLFRQGDVVQSQCLCRMVLLHASLGA